MVDFYATIAIILIVIVFFLILHYKTAKVTNTITGEELGLDANRIALLYAQTPVATSLGRMTFAEYLITAAEDETRQEAYIAATEKYFEELQEAALVTIVIIRNVDGEEKAEVLIEPSYFRQALSTVQERCKNLEHATIQILEACYLAGEGYSAPSQARIPLHDPNNYALIQVQTKISE